MFKCFIKNEISDEDYRNYRKFSYQVGNEEYIVLFKETDDIFTYEVQCLKPEKYSGSNILTLKVNEAYLRDNLEYILKKMNGTEEDREYIKREIRQQIAIHKMERIIAEIKGRELKEKIIIDEDKRIIKYGKYSMNYKRVYYPWKNDLQELTGSRYVMIGIQPKEYIGKESFSHLKIADSSFSDFVTMYIDTIVDEIKRGV